MTRYLLDTNIISDLIKPKPSASLVAWMEARRDEDLYIASLTLAEIWRGILEKPSGGKRGELETWFNGPEGPPTLFDGRILPFDDRASLIWARLMADGKQTGRPRGALDTIIAAVALVHECTIVTDNERDFAGLPILNPIRR
jgi:toxin FitB